MTQTGQQSANLIFENGNSALSLVSIARLFEASKTFAREQFGERAIMGAYLLIIGIAVQWLEAINAHAFTRKRRGRKKRA